jgi:histidine ammonia-lyase
LCQGGTTRPGPEALLNGRAISTGLAFEEEQRRQNLQEQANVGTFLSVMALEGVDKPKIMAMFPMSSIFIE